MPDELHDRLTGYRTTIEAAIDLDRERWPHTAQLRHPGVSRQRFLVGAAAAVIVVVGVAGLGWLANDRSQAPVSDARIANDDALELDTGRSVVSTAPMVVPDTTTSLDTTTAPMHGVIRKLAIGEVQMLSAASELIELGFTVDAAESRYFTDIVQPIEQLRSQNLLGETVVIHAGTNTQLDVVSVDAVMEALSDVPLVVVLTISGDQEWTETNNLLIRALPERYPNTRIIEWQYESGQCASDCLYADNVHLRPTGQVLYAQLIERATEP